MQFVLVGNFGLDGKTGTGGGIRATGSHLNPATKSFPNAKILYEPS